MVTFGENTGFGRNMIKEDFNIPSNSFHEECINLELYISLEINIIFKNQIALWMYHLNSVVKIM